MRRLQCSGKQASVILTVQSSSAWSKATLLRPLHAAVDDPAREDTAVQHFYDKLLHIREQLKTAPGKIMADKRHKFVGSV